jgi:hypothetical protein
MSDTADRAADYPARHRPHRRLPGHWVGGRSRRPPRYTTTRGRRDTTNRRPRTRGIRRSAVGMGHPHPAGQRRTHTQRQRTRTQPAIRSALTTTTNQPQISHGRFYTAVRRGYSLVLVTPTEVRQRGPVPLAGGPR